MAALVELLLMLAFLVWACAHTARRSGWHQDEVEAEEFIAQLKQQSQPHLLGMPVFQSHNLPPGVQAIVIGNRDALVVPPKLYQRLFAAAVAAGMDDWRTS